MSAGPPKQLNFTKAAFPAPECWTQHTVDLGALDRCQHEHGSLVQVTGQQDPETAEQKQTSLKRSYPCSSALLLSKLSAEINRNNKPAETMLNVYSDVVSFKSTAAKWADRRRSWLRRSSSHWANHNVTQFPKMLYDGQSDFGYKVQSAVTAKR